MGLGRRFGLGLGLGLELGFRGVRVRIRVGVRARAEGRVGAAEVAQQSRAERREVAAAQEERR